MTDRESAEPTGKRRRRRHRAPVEVVSDSTGDHRVAAPTNKRERWTREAFSSMGISPIFRAYIFLGSIVAILAFLLYNESLTSELREQEKNRVDLYARLISFAPMATDEQTMTIFTQVIHNPQVDFPCIITNYRGEITERRGLGDLVGDNETSFLQSLAFWQEKETAVALGDSVYEKALRRLMRKMDAENEPIKYYLSATTAGRLYADGQRAIITDTKGDIAKWRGVNLPLTVEREGGKRPFSKGLLAHSLEATGLAPDDAYRIASAIEEQLIDERREDIGHRELERLTADLLAREHGDSYAERYRVWRAWGNLDKPLIILICGPSGAGKTTLAIALATLLDIPRVVATDDIRQMMRLTLTAELLPTLHSSTYNAWEKLPDPSPGEDAVIAGYREQARTICVGASAIISRCLEENSSVVIDGVHLLPDFLDLKRYAKSAFVVPLCIALTDEKEYAKRFTRRAEQAPQRPKHRYLAHMEEIFKIQEHMIECYNSCDLPVISDESSEELVAAAAMMVSEQLQEIGEIRKAMVAEEKKKRKSG